MTDRDAVVHVVDDDRSVRDALARLIGSVGLEVRTFDSAEAFLGAEHEDRPGCIVLDVRMPGLSGLDLRDRLAARRIGLPIVFITGHGTIPMSVGAMKAGAVDFLTKPFDDQQLLDAIRRALDVDLDARRAGRRLAEIGRLIRSLTPREREVFALVVTGRTNKQIGDELGASDKTIKIHRARVMRKMGAESLPDLVRLAETARAHSPKELASYDQGPMDRPGSGA